MSDSNDNGAGPAGGRDALPNPVAASPISMEKANNRIEEIIFGCELAGFRG
jgi:hypothetical protein